MSTKGNYFELKDTQLTKKNNRKRNKRKNSKTEKNIRK